MCRVRSHRGAAAEHDSGGPREDILLQPQGRCREPDVGCSESDQSLRVQTAVPEQTAVSPHLYSHSDNCQVYMLKPSALK